MSLTNEDKAKQKIIEELTNYIEDNPFSEKGHLKIAISSLVQKIFSDTLEKSFPLDNISLKLEKIILERIPQMSNSEILELSSFFSGNISDLERKILYSVKKQCEDFSSRLDKLESLTPYPIASNKTPLLDTLYKFDNKVKEFEKTESEILMLPYTHMTQEKEVCLDISSPLMQNKKYYIENFENFSLPFEEEDSLEYFKILREKKKRKKTNNQRERDFFEKIIKKIMFMPDVDFNQSDFNLPIIESTDVKINKNIFIRAFRKFFPTPSSEINSIDEKKDIISSINETTSSTKRRLKINKKKKVTTFPKTKRKRIEEKAINA